MAYQALQIRLPQERTRDTALCYPLRRDMGVKREGEYPALKAVGKKVLGVEIQKEGDVGGHDPVSLNLTRAREELVQGCLVI